MLEGFKVLEIGHFVAAPFGARLLADLGADLIKVEPPTGDPVRAWGAQQDGNSLWWSVHGRNKRCISINLKKESGRALLLDLVEKCDAVIENFRPGQLARMGLGPDVLRQRNPGLIIAHISGYGQEGPYRDRAAFGVIGEAMGGLRYLTNQLPGPDQPAPVRVGVSIGDSIAGLYAAFGIMAAAWKRDGRTGDGKGRSLDIALTESVFSMMEAMLPEFGKLGRIKEPTGGAIATAAPSNAYPTADGEWVLIAGNSEPIFARLCGLMGQPELAQAERFRNNVERVAHATELDGIIAQWTRGQRAADLLDLLNAADVPSSKIFNAADCAMDPQFRERAMVREIDDPLLGKILHPGVVPSVVGEEMRIRWTGPAIGAHNREIFSQVLGRSDSEIAQLESDGAI